ncbi:hypothetical protein [Croceivirga radicis]|uniref:hypothetical protein n=1 Tax=Croceivirga radicis TaxID=1929488 RepID=UPI000255AFD0|nr:hypothetical protein [Croceivirga radicis]
MKIEISLLILVLGLLSFNNINAQRFELMPGTERLFFDIQWFEKFDSQGKWTLFSRTRGSYDYEDTTDIFSGAYFEYTTKSGFGPTFLGRIASTVAGAELGVHFIKQINNWSIYSLLSQEIRNQFDISWFSIVKFTPNISKTLKLYSSVELFMNFEKADHNVSVQRFRTGITKNNYFIGIGLNTTFTGTNFDLNYTNLGIFVKKQF